MPSIQFPDCPANDLHCHGNVRRRHHQVGHRADGVRSEGEDADAGLVEFEREGCRRDRPARVKSTMLVRTAAGSSSRPGIRANPSANVRALAWSSASRAR